MEALDSAFVGVLRCPITRSPLRWIPRGLWEDRFLGEAGEEWKQRTSGWEGGLLRGDGKGMYPVRGGIPVLLGEEFVELPEKVKSVLADAVV